MWDALMGLFGRTDAQGARMMVLKAVF